MPDRSGKSIGARAGVSVGATLLLVLAVCLGSPPARADEGPQIVTGPNIAGVTQVGQTLTATATYTGTPAPTESWTWLRCTDKGASTCSPIPDATQTTYVPTAADLAYRLRVRLTVRNPVGVVRALSGATGAVLPAPSPTPTPTPTPAPTATATPAPTATATPSATAAPSPTITASTASSGAARPSPAPSGAGPVTLLEPPLLRPFPVVRMRGRFTRNGVYVTLLTIRAPRGARIAIRCAGRGCPVRRWARVAALMHARTFEGALPAGVRLTVRISRPGWIGKYTSLLIRRGAPPARRDRCLYPGSTRPRPCRA